MKEDEEGGKQNLEGGHRVAGEGGESGEVLWREGKLLD